MGREVKATYEDLSLIMRRLDSTEQFLLDSEKLTEKGKTYLTSIVNNMRDAVKVDMFYALMDYMIATGRLTVGAPKTEPRAEDGETDT